ncbi:unnamed protein product [Angiostrongylus costaricensis]|uniref:Endo/exonuclease/phosphatase domain-containing protein n=1 Tax=Angiostrongylus costaricensis TaxID=334426 RepID=A0A0R3PWE6_ANGCS|nr:unnamed protein product [Angiostrongylus costaricensis]
MPAFQRRQCSRQHEFVHQHRFIRTANNPNQTFMIKKTLINTGIDNLRVYASTSNYSEKEVEAFYMDLEKFYREDHTFFKVIIGHFNAKIGLRRTSEKRHIGNHGLKCNEEGERLPQLIMASKTIHVNSQFQKPHPKRWT